MMACFQSFLSRKLHVTLQSTIHQDDPTKGFKILSINTIEQRMLTQTIKFSVHFFEGVTTFRKFAVSYTLK